MNIIQRCILRFIKPLTKIVTIVLCVGLVGCKSLSLGVLHPKGTIALQQRNLLFDAIALMLIVVIPVIIMSFAFVVRYRASHKTAGYRPNWAHSVFLETIWWGVPCVIIIVLGIITWRTSHSLDPYRKINVPGKPLLIQAVALPWKWLFIYPEQNIATVKYLEIPVDRQVEFWLTTDNVAMSAFFIPQLGSQIYTMAGMRTRLHLLGSKEGVFEGVNTQYNGSGFSDMHFKAHVVSNEEMQKWFKKVKMSSRRLSYAAYDQLRKPSDPTPVHYYSGVEPHLFEDVIKAYMMPVHPQRVPAH